MTVARIGLYYPYAHFSYKTWLKAAALYWPKIARIVPAGFPINDDSITRALIDELDFVIDISPDSVRTDAGKLMMEAMAIGGSQLRDKYRIPSDLISDDQARGYRLDIDNWAAILHRIDEADIWSLESGASGWDTLFPVASLSIVRMAIPLRLHLLRQDMAIRDDNLWLGVHPKWAWVYMCVLAEQLAQHNNLLPVTDQIMAHYETNGWTPEGIVDTLHGQPPSHASEQAPETAIGMLALKLAVPSSLSDIPVQEIIHIRRRYGADFDAFHDAVAYVAAELCSEFENIADRAILEAYLAEAVKRHFERPLADLRKIFRAVGVDAAFAAANMKFALPAALVAGGGIAVHQPVIAGAGSAAFGVLTLGRTAGKNWAERTKPSAASYLWRVERGVTPESLLRTLLLQKGQRRCR